MYKLLIVEDEPLIRKGLTKYFDWEELGFHLIYEAENGAEGVQVALQEQPDLVITDIRMPLMDGLEMIEQLREKLPTTLFVIWSGYNEFSYAQRALRLGNVFAYLLKPLQYQESMKTIQDCIELLEKRRKEQENLLALAHESEDYVHLKRSQIVKYLLEDRNLSETAEQELREELSAYIDMYKGFKLQPIVLSYVPASSPALKTRAWWRQNAERILTSLLTHTHASTNTLPPFLSYLSHSKLYAFTVVGESEYCAPYLGSDTRDKLTAILHQEGAFNQVHLYLSIGPLAEDFKMLSSLLVQTDKSLFERFHPASGSIFEVKHSNLSLVKGTQLSLTDQDKVKFLACLEQHDASPLKEFLHRIAVDAESKVGQYVQDQWLPYIQEIITVAMRFASKHGLNMEERYHEKLLHLTFLDDFDSMTAMFDWLSHWMVQLQVEAQQSGGEEESLDGAIFERIEEFIIQHIDQDVTLQMVADQFFYNPSYLSRLFKTKLNKNYMTFVTEIRIEFAKRCLLQSKTLMTDVCHMCGYTSYKHFVKMFRKFTNMTPTDYRKKMGMID
ncbi:response regulator transcription factor [Paenibacillus sp. EC2-1]|uniref:response regulator transcription factor n=1 Tax=Paenibacillus sp. EC2-1 TaxID=3388665 RepID=UPI003BEEC509